MNTTHGPTMVRPVGISRQVLLGAVAMFIIAAVAAVAFFDTARSSPDAKQYVPVAGSNPGVRGQGGR